VSGLNFFSEGVALRRGGREEGERREEEGERRRERGGGGREEGEGDRSATWKNRYLFIIY